MNTVQPIRDMDLLQDILDYLESSSYRNFIMFLIGIDTGLRIGDILRLRVRDVMGTHISIREKKTRKQKRILITGTLKKKLMPYIEGKASNEFLIKSREGLNRPITREMAYKIIRAVAEEFGLMEIACHSLRKTFGYIFYNQTTNKDIALLMRYYNHSSPQETLRYIGMEQDSMDMALKRHRR
ncbi:integrase [Paenibacillus algicola]|uniref:Integrase n=1 Tax=Paenibacillus algicola TaxID=2565926 RepID=A0A4P8XM18_9BACL|nr:tyrosine-type recombinase/integrase [Paenibacillus algicola]QCT02710.1 integrase [Paenibacillus algicola]